VFETADGRARGQDALDEALDAELARMSKEEAFERLQRAGIACAPVLSATELVEDEHLNARGLFQLVTHPIWGSRRSPGLPWRIDGDGPVAITAPPVLGEYPRESLALLR
jgi:crotonobetainyl-CoA:carnitine CoA-transferase CaiB-like acyl-CoA transferase